MAIPISFRRRGDRLDLYNVPGDAQAVVRHENVRTGRMVLYLPKRSVRRSRRIEYVPAKWILARVVQGDMRDGKFEVMSRLQPGARWRLVEKGMVGVMNQHDERLVRVWVDYHARRRGGER